jgi:heme-degrading monooxygenase HmoA
MIVSIVRFRSGLTDQQVQTLYEARADRYREVPGLMEKLYVRYRTGEHGAVYVWRDEDALEAFRASDLGRSIGSAYEVEGEPVAELADVTLVVGGRAVDA